MKCSLLVFFIFMPIILFAQFYGCTDLAAKNYNPNAVINDGSCQYLSSKIKPFFSTVISNEIHESSGLTFWDDRLWTMNDDGDANLYSLDTIGVNLRNFPLAKVKNKDWEALAQDSSYFYIGDFGNNVSGNRTDLHILKIDKKELFENRIKVDTIAFSFENQINFEPKTVNTTDFDCETLLVTKDSIYILTKEWSNRKTSLYVMPKIAGGHIAKFKASLNVGGLITGGVILEQKKTIVLCGYSKKLQPFLYLLYDYSGSDFFSGNKRKIKVGLPFHQIEGIATKDGLQYYLTNENFNRKPFIAIPQQLHKLDLSMYLKLFFANSLN